VELVTGLLDHIDGTVDLLAMPHDPDWSTIDANIIRWFFQTVSTDIFHTIVRDGDTARDVWKKITGPLLGKPLSVVHLFGLQWRTCGAPRISSHWYLLPVAHVQHKNIQYTAEMQRYTHQ
jgi:hypothetical protein